MLAENEEENVERPLCCVSISVRLEPRMPYAGLYQSHGREAAKQGLGKT